MAYSTGYQSQPDHYITTVLRGHELPPADRAGEAAEGSAPNLGNDSVRNLLELDHRTGEAIGSRALCEDGVGLSRVRGSSGAGQSSGRGGHAAVPIAHALREAGTPGTGVAGSGSPADMPPAAASGWVGNIGGIG